MKEILPLLPRPSRYIGSEWGTVRKDPDKVSGRLALAFPDLYEVGMSYTGQKILLESVNRFDHLWAERVYTPCRETAEIMREHEVTLATLESDTPLSEMDAVAFSLTHELCYTNVLFMLDLAGIPLKTSQRDDSHPLIMAGGGACFNAEPLADYIDLMVIGDGEEVLPDILDRLAKAKHDGISRDEFLKSLVGLPGIYIPAMFEFQGQDKGYKSLVAGYDRVKKAVVQDMESQTLPLNQPVSFGQAVHDRLTMEIARGCTRGCRFCQAGMIYRPVRERGPEFLNNALQNGLAETGYEETSFLSLSTGDYSALESLFTESFDRCAAEQVSISLPSMRVGSISEPIMQRIASVRRTGATLAPEAGSQRLRDVINKGIDEEQLLDHVRMLFDNGWQMVKLYFMIGLPTETDDDLKAIVDLCLKVRDAAGRHIKRLQVSASASPFVPKPHTPFQWETQINLEEMKRRIWLLRDLFRPHKRISIKTHVPEMSFLEGIFSRGDRRLGPVIQSAYDKGALFSSWKDELDLSQYLEAMDEHGLNPEDFLSERNPDIPLPWSHLESGVSKRFLLSERDRALKGKITEDCRYHACRNCGVCNHGGRESALVEHLDNADIRPRVIFETRDQIPADETRDMPEKKGPDLAVKGMHLRIWYSKTGPAAYLSQLEIQNLFERTMRRANLPMTFSAGFHPLPRMSFGMALPVGVESKCEWFNIFLREELRLKDIVSRMAECTPPGIEVYGATELSHGKKQAQPVSETFEICFKGNDNQISAWRRQWTDFMEAKSFPVERMTKRGAKTSDLRPLVTKAEFIEQNSMRLVFDWTKGYLNPLTAVKSVNAGISPLEFAMTKIEQQFPDGTVHTGQN